MPQYIISHHSGMNRATSDVLRDKSEYALLMNWNNDTVGSLTKVPGTTQLGSQIVNNAAVDSIFEHRYVTGGATTRTLVATVSSKPYYYSSGWLSASGFSPVETEVESWATIDNNLYVMSPTRGLYKSTDGGQSYSAVSASPSGKYITTYRNFLWAAGDPNFPTRVWKSEIGGSTEWSTQEFDGATYETAGDAVIGLTSQNDQLLIFQASGRIDRNNTAQQRQFVTTHVGIDNQNVAENDYFAFWAPNEKMFAYVGSTPQDISRRIADVLRGSSNTVGFTFKRNYNLFTDDVTIDDEAFTNTLMMYDVDNDAFHMRDDLDIKSATQAVISGKEFIVFGDSDGNVWYVDPDETKNNAGANSNITAVAISVPHYIVNPKIIKKFNSIFILSNQGQGTTLDFRVDYGNWYQVGQLQERFTLFDDLGIPEGRVIEYRLTHTGNGTRPEIQYIEIDYDLTHARRN